MSNLEMYSNVLTNRKSMYLFLANLYKIEVSKDFYNVITKIDFPIDDNTKLSEGYRMIKNFCAMATVDPVTDLAVDFARVFLGAGITEKERCAFPYESVYTSPKGLIMQEARDEVLALYRKHGLGKDDSFNVPEDHISLEFEFMAHLCTLTIRAVESDRQYDAMVLLEEQKDFISAHLNRWIRSFCADIAKCSNTGFYRGLANITEAFIELEMDLTEDLTENLQETMAG